jgi:polysaccharide export outer membrane protein
VVALRVQPVSSLTLDAVEPLSPASILSTPLQLETLVSELKGRRLGWRVILGLRLYSSEAFAPGFAGRFSGFQPGAPGTEAREYLLDRFEKKLKVSVVPRTLLIEVRFRTRDAELSATVVNALVEAYKAEERESRVGATQEGVTWLNARLTGLDAELAVKEKRLAAFEREHGFVSTQQAAEGAAAVETLHDPAVQQIDEAGRLLAAAMGERILREALYRQAQAGDPEQVLAGNPELAAQMGSAGAGLTAQLRGQLSGVRVEMAELTAEHGAKFPRVVELQRAESSLEAQLKAEDAKLVAGFERIWRAAADREALLKQQMDARMTEGLKQNDAALGYGVLHGEVVAGRAMESRLRQRVAEAGMAAGVHGASITVVDPAEAPFKAASPDLPLYLAITFFVGTWLALLVVLAMDVVRPPRLRRRAAAMLAGWIVMAGMPIWGQAPTPSTQGIPTGVVRLPADVTPQAKPNARTAPAVWNAGAGTEAQTAMDASETRNAAGASMVLPLAAGDLVEVSEFHTPEFRTQARVAADGSVVLPMVGAVKVAGLPEEDAAKAVAKVLIEDEMLLHPQVTVLVLSAAGQDVSVLGEVVRPGVYPYAVHHRLLDLLSAASGTGPNAGRLVSIVHREDGHGKNGQREEGQGGDAKTPQMVVLDPSGTDTKGEHNPELEPGDTVQVSRAGLVYVIGDVVRPGGFAVDPVQGLTVVQALSLAWGATPNAAEGKAMLIRDQPGGRTLTILNLKRMIRGQDPDLPVKDRDILFVPDSAAKDLLHKTMESAIQSAVGVSIYAGLVYSQRF